MSTPALKKLGMKMKLDFGVCIQHPLWAELYSPKIHMSKSQLSVLQNVIAFGEKALKEVMKLKEAD